MKDVVGSIPVPIQIEPPLAGLRDREDDSVVRELIPVEGEAEVCRASSCGMEDVKDSIIGIPIPVEVTPYADGTLVRFVNGKRGNGRSDQVAVDQSTVDRRHRHQRPRRNTQVEFGVAQKRVRNVVCGVTVAVQVRGGEVVFTDEKHDQIVRDLEVGALQAEAHSDGRPRFWNKAQPERKRAEGDSPGNKRAHAEILSDNPALFGPAATYAEL